MSARRVLVVDDDEGVRTAVTWALEADGFVVEAVEAIGTLLHPFQFGALALVEFG